MGLRIQAVKEVKSTRAAQEIQLSDKESKIEFQLNGDQYQLIRDPDSELCELSFQGTKIWSTRCQKFPTRILLDDYDTNGTRDAGLEIDGGFFELLSYRESQIHQRLYCWWKKKGWDGFKYVLSPKATTAECKQWRIIRGCKDLYPEIATENLTSLVSNKNDCSIDTLLEFGLNEAAAKILYETGVNKEMNEHWRLHTAYRLAEMGKINEAAAIYLDLATDNKVNEIIRLRSAGNLRHTEKTSEATRGYISILEDDNVSPNIKVNSAIELREAGETQSAEIYLLKLSNDVMIAFDIRLKALKELMPSQSQRMAVARIVAEMTMETGITGDELLALAAMLDENEMPADSKSVYRYVSMNEAAEVNTRLRAISKLDKISDKQIIKTALQRIAMSRDRSVVEKVLAARSLYEAGMQEEALEACLSIIKRTDTPVESKFNIVTFLNPKIARRLYIDWANDKRVDVLTQFSIANRLEQAGYNADAINIYIKICLNKKVAADNRLKAAENMRKLGQKAEASKMFEMINRDVEANNKKIGQVVGEYLDYDFAQALGKFDIVNENTRDGRLVFSSKRMENTFLETMEGNGVSIDKQCVLDSNDKTEFTLYCTRRDDRIAFGKSGSRIDVTKIKIVLAALGEAIEEEFIVAHLQEIEALKAKFKG